MLALAVPQVTRPTAVDFAINRAEQHFDLGKKASQEGRRDEARQEFDTAVEALLSVSEIGPDRERVERRLDDMIDQIYRYDSDQLGAGQPTEQASYDKSPLDEILEMTFPVDPALRSKVRAQIAATSSQLPLEESDAVISYVNYFSSARGQKILASGLKHSGRYKDMIEKVLMEEGVPQELIFVAQAESGFQPRAVSNKRCVGLWQFAKFRGQEYKLTVNAVADERMDPEKATRAAAKHLHDLYDHFGDWYLALAAYDCGPGCVDHAVMRTGYADFWTLRRLNVLPQETANYVPVILAMTIIAKNAKDYGLGDLEYEKPLEYDTIELPSATNVSLAASALDRPASEIRSLNPALLKPVAPAGFALHLPKGTLPLMQAALEIVPPDRRDAWRIHKVDEGDSFAALAKRYGTTPALISSANHDEMPEAGAFALVPVAYPGDKVPVKPTVKKRSTASAAAAAKTPATASKSGTVRKQAVVSKPSSKAPARRTSHS